MDATRRDFRYNNALFRAARGTGAAVAAHLPQIQASAMETNPIHNLIKDLSERTAALRGYL